MSEPRLHVVVETGNDANPATAPTDQNAVAAPVKITKPKFRDRFKSKLPPDIGGVVTPLQALPVMRIADAIDFARLHPDEENYWTGEQCFVDVPIKGEKRMMLCIINEELAVKHFAAKRIRRFQLALAARPHDAFFLCIVPTQNLDNTWNKTAHEACMAAKHYWTQALSRKQEQGIEGYMLKYAEDQDAFPPPKWPSYAIDEILEVSFCEAMIEDENHPAFARLLGRKQDLK
jgi:hypothetical protein